MNTRQAKQTAKEWVEANIEKWPGICGAHLVGGITSMPDDALFPFYKDVDIHLIFEEGSPALVPTGPFLNLLETQYKGLLLEAGMKSMKEYESAEVVLSNPEIADHLTVDSVLYDPGGWLSSLREQVKREFPRRKWVLARVDYERNGLKGALELVEMTRNMGGAFVKGSIPGYTFTFIGALLCIAALKPPTTGSRELLRVREILVANDRLDLYEGFLTILGVRNVSPERMEQLLQEGSEAFDLAVQVRRTPHPFQHKLHSHLKPYFIDSCKSLMDEGYHCEAMAWLIPWYLASTDVIMVDGPDVEKPAFAECSTRLLREMGMGTAEARTARMEHALPHEKSAFVLFTTSFVSKYFPPFYQDHFFSRVALHNKRKLLSCIYRGRLFMRQLMALLSLWQNSSASDLSWEAHVGEKVNLQSRRALLKQFAPQYREASYAQKRVLLDVFAQATGYHRRYGMWLLNHAEDVLHTPAYKRSNHYGLEVQHALFLIWNAANRICAKRLMPLLPTLIDALERHEHLQISDECRRQLLSMSAATADRLLSSQRKVGLRGPSITRAGTLLKQQIPIRTFQQWNETRPGFLEADLVAHCGTIIEGGYLYTLTLTDVATGWTECLPLLYRSQETVLAALQRARTLFPFPILGIDTDNGGEFINEAVIAYCEQEQITFTRGRPYLKNDQCFVEQKNGAIVRQVVGYDRLVGEYAYRQLTELYRALRLYVNCFQPSMKLLSKQREGKKVRYVYDPAKTPLQRLLQSGVLPAQEQQELTQVAQALDPVCLFQQLEQLQQALFRCAVSCSPFVSHTPSAPIRVFSVECFTTGNVPIERSVPCPAAGFHNLYREQERRKRILGWRRTQKDLFEGEWEQILSWLIANPERSSGDIFRELQRLSPGRYQPLQIRTLQRGMRKIRVHLLQTFEEQWHDEVIREPSPASSSPAERATRMS